jgi:AcrR family transcriptional regulator
VVVTQARLTREEKKAQTRERLLEAAATVFARRGFAAASLDEVAEEAGLTKGAVYSNFANKEDLVLALMDDRFSHRIDQVVGQLDSTADIGEQARKAGALFMAISDEERWLQLLSLDFLTYAARNPEFGARYSARHRESTETIAELIERSADELGLGLPLPPGELAIVMNALGVGLSLEKLVDPDNVPDDLFGKAISLIYGFGAPKP